MLIKSCCFLGLEFHYAEHRVDLVFLVVFFRFFGVSGINEAKCCEIVGFRVGSLLFSDFVGDGFSLLFPEQGYFRSILGGFLGVSH